MLSDWLEFVQMTDLSRIVDDPAVWSPLHRIAGTLHRALPWIFTPDYAERLAAARAPSLPTTRRSRPTGSEHETDLPKLAVAASQAPTGAGSSVLNNPSGLGTTISEPQSAP